ncbi:MAG: type VII toxin-antitoxin system MntA family adenylyltransferase antitoxin [Halanaerobiales bacterium]
MEEKIKKRLLKVFDNYELTLLIIFGSYNSDNFNEDSDIDLAIKVNDSEQIRKNKKEILDKISSIFDHRDIDLILLNYAEALIKFKIACEGSLIYEKKKGLFQKFQIRAMSEHNDARKFYELDKKFMNDFLEGRKKNGRKNVSPPKIK